MRPHRPSDKQERGEASSKFHSRLEVPKYLDTREISYTRLVRDVQNLNPTDQPLSQDRLQSVLRAAFIDVIGEKRFREIESGDRRGSKAAWDAGQWNRLMRECREYWEAEEKKEEEARSDGGREYEGED